MLRIIISALVCSIAYARSPVSFHPPVRQGGNFPSGSGNFPGNSGNFPGNSGNFPGNSGGFPGNSGNFPGNSGGFPGNSGGFPGNSGGFLGPISVLAGPWEIVGPTQTCHYYRIRNFAIRGFNTIKSVANHPFQCARRCNEYSWCNSFEFSANRQCYLSKYDIYTPQTIVGWNQAKSWDYWQLRSCRNNGGGGHGFAGQASPVASDPGVPLPGVAASPPAQVSTFSADAGSSNRGANRVTGVQLPFVSQDPSSLNSGDQFFTSSDPLEGSSGGPVNNQNNNNGNNNFGSQQNFGQPDNFGSGNNFGQSSGGSGGGRGASRF